MPLIPSALTSVENAKAHLNVPSANTDQTARLELMINAATARIESMTDRLLKERTLTEVRSGRRSNLILLRQWPVNSITSVKLDAKSVFDAGTEITGYQIADDNTAIHLIGDVWPNGFNNIQIVYTAGYNSTDHAGNLAELEIATLWLVEWFYKHRERGDMGRTSKSKGDESVGILAQMPTMIREIIMDYKRTEAALGDRPVVNL